MGAQDQEQMSRAEARAEDARKKKKTEVARKNKTEVAHEKTYVARKVLLMVPDDIGC